MDYCKKLQFFRWKNAENYNFPDFESSENGSIGAIVEADKGLSIHCDGCRHLGPQTSN